MSSSSSSSVIADRIRQAETLKQEGNEFFQKGKYGKARTKYSTVFAYINGLGVSTTGSSSNNSSSGSGDAGMSTFAATTLKQDRPTPREEEAIRQLSLSCHSNIAMCHFKKQEWEKVLVCCDRALAIKADHVKSLCRKGTALSRLSIQPETAVRCLETAIELDPQIAGRAAKKELQHLKRRLKLSEERSDQKLARALRGNL